MHDIECWLKMTTDYKIKNNLTHIRRLSSPTFDKEDIVDVTYCHKLMNTAISRKFVKNKVHATIPKGNMGYDQYPVSNDCSSRTYFCYFPSALANIYQWPPVRFF